jgi:protein gp37
MLNKQTAKTIDWCSATWNPISGCKGPNGKPCDYCYLIRMEKRYQRGMMVPMFHADRLYDVEKAHPAPGSKIFVGSSGDMFGNWVEKEAILKVIEVCKRNPDLIFQFLTKNPKRYGEFYFPKNCWLGTTIENDKDQCQIRFKDFVNACTDKLNIRFVSFEPLMSGGCDIYVPFIDWAIIGANSNPGSFRPPNEWAENIINEAQKQGVAVWMKNNYNYLRRIKEWPDESKFKQ